MPWRRVVGGLWSVAPAWRSRWNGREHRGPAISGPAMSKPEPICATDGVLAVLAGGGAGAGPRHGCEPDVRRGRRSEAARTHDVSKEPFLSTDVRWHRGSRSRCGSDRSAARLSRRVRAAEQLRWPIAPRHGTNVMRDRRTPVSPQPGTLASLAAHGPGPLPTPPTLVVEVDAFCRRAARSHVIHQCVRCLAFHVGVTLTEQDGRWLGGRDAGRRARHRDGDDPREALRAALAALGEPWASEMATSAEPWTRSPPVGNLGS